MVALLGPADVLHGHMRHHLVHGAESSVTSFFGPVYLVLIYPLAGHLLFYGLPHVAEECAWPMVRGHVHPHVHVDRVIVIVERSGAVRIRARTRNRAIRIRPPEKVPTQTNVHLSIHYVSSGRSMAHALLVKSWEQKVARVVRDSRGCVETPCRSGEDPVLRACSRRVAPVSEQEISRGVERASTVRTDLPSVMVVSERSCISGSLRGESRCLAWGNIVCNRANFKRS